MHHDDRILSLTLPLLLALGAPACLFDPEIIGETLPNVSGAPTDTDGDTSTGAGSVSATTEIPVVAPYGAPCQLAGVGPEIQSNQVTEQPACAGGICLFLAGDAKVACETDEFCSMQWIHDVCGTNGYCNIAQEVIDDRSKCTQTCEVDSECAEIPGCMLGAACLPAALEGPFCCQKVCACRDTFGTEALKTLQITCADPEANCS